MEFAGKVWKLLVGIKDGLVLAVMLLFFMALYGVLTARPSPGLVRDGALLVRLNGAIVEEPALVDPLAALMSSSVPTREYRARDLARALRAAAKDDRIKAVVLDLSRFTGGGLVSLQEVGAALDTVRAANKPVLAWAFAYADNGLLLAAHASEVWVDPMGGAFVQGPGGHSIYYKGLLDRFKVTAHVYRVGTYKDAVEPYLGSGQSPASKEARRALYDAIWSQWKAEVGRARPKANIQLVASDPAGWLKAAGGDAAEAAKSAGLVDRIGTHTQFGERVAELVGKDPLERLPGTYAHTRLSAWLADNPPEKSGKAIGVVTIAGEIVDGKAGPGVAGGERIARLLDEALDKNLAALVVRVDSPGGSVTASEEIRTAIERHKARGIPVAVSMGNLAASGGYWVSTPGQRVFAEPGTITGSIGIFAVLPSFERALADYGVTFDGVRTTPLSGQPDLIGGLTPEVDAMIQANIESGYARFLRLVAAARGKTPQEIDRIAQGRAWDGGTARQMGLVDQFGGLDDALDWAAKAAKLEDGGWHAEFLGDDVTPYASLLERLTGGEDEDEVEGSAASGRDLVGLAAQHQQDVLTRALAGVERLLSVRGAQAYCLECPAPPGADRRAAQPGLIARIIRFAGIG